jgi:hypothetical protein
MECGLPVKVGREYVRVGWLCDGNWNTYRVHAECYALARFIEREVCGDHGTILTEGLGEEIANLGEYDGGYRPSEREDMIAMGIGEWDSDDPANDPEAEFTANAAHVAEWLWNCIKAEYQV